MGSHDSLEAASPIACENCGTAMRGAFCPACGQSRINPIRHAGHALEEVFESFWHLDGRVFRTVRDLFVPGRVACDYIAGHRMRYVAPLRLFFVLSVLTFFVAQSLVHWDKGIINIDPTPSVKAGPAFANARTVEAVVTERDAQIERIRATQAEVANVPFASAGLEKSIEVLNAGADARIRAIRGGKLPPPIPDLPRGGSDAGFEDVAKSPSNPMGITIRGKPWNEKTNPFTVDGWPRVTRWLNARVGVMARNIPRVSENPDLLKDAIFKSIPPALLILVPVFALLLKLAYVRRGRLYLEHLVVALYSHAYLCIGVLGVLALTWLQNAIAIDAIDVLLGFVKGLLWTWLPVYLLLTQKRVYGQGWVRTTLKFLLLGSIYATLLTFAVLPLFLVGFLRA